MLPCPDPLHILKRIKQRLLKTNVSLTTKPDVVYKSGLASFKATMLSLFEDENEIIHYEDSPQNAMSDTAAMAVLKPSHIYRLLDTDLEDLLFLHIYVLPPFVPFLENTTLRRIET